MKTHEVFGISPTVNEHSYVDRGHLDKTLATILGRTTHLAIRGPSKCGKSWLRQKALANPITVQCRLQKPFTDIYVDALSQLDIKIQVKESKQGSFQASVSAKGEAGAALLAKAGIKGTLGHDSSTSTDSKTVGHDINDLRFVADIINKSERRLVIEDFHYMSPSDRRAFSFDLKALWDYNTFVVIIGVWSETNLLLFLNPDLSGRVQEMSIEWSDTDLDGILTKGGRTLNIDFDPAYRKKLVSLSYSNAGLLQQLTLLSLDDAKITESGFLKQNVTDTTHVDNASMAHAEQLKPVYQQFAKTTAAGVRSRANSTGIYAHTMAVIMEASDEELIRGLKAKVIFDRANKRQSRIQQANLKSILEKIPELQVDDGGRGLIIDYSPATEEVTIVDRQLLLYRKYSTVKWPWEDLIAEADAKGGQVDAG